MINTYLKKSVILALGLFANMSFGMVKDAPTANVGNFDIKNIALSTAAHGLNGASCAVANGRFLYQGIDEIRAYFQKPNINDSNAVTLENIDRFLENEMPQLVEGKTEEHKQHLAREYDKKRKEIEDIRKAIKTAAQKMNMSPDMLVTSTWDSVPSSPAAASTNGILKINVPVFMQLNTDEKEGIIGHECSHLINRDGLVRGLANIAAPIVSHVILNGYEYSANRLLDVIQMNLATGNKASVLIPILKKCNALIASNLNFIPRYLLNLCLVKKVSQYQETRADRDSALILKKPQAIISSLNKELNFSNKFILNMTIVSEILSNLKRLDATLGMKDHPSTQERIKALEKIEKQLA